MNNIKKIKEVLKENGLRVTQSRLAVAAILTRSNSVPLTSEEVFHKIKSSKVLHCDQVSVYRILSKFEELNIVKKSIFQGEASRYMIQDEKNKPGQHHEHFFKCIACNTIESIEGCLVSRKEKELESRGYTNLNHHLEITGICPSCTQI